MIHRLAILGVGLIGGSLARALKQRHACERVIGYGRSEARLQKAVELGVIDEYHTDPARAVEDADMILLATPLAAFEPLLKSIAGSIKQDAIITDAGSAKGSVVEAAEKALTPAQLKRFIPGHPVAGTEKSGVEASFAELFQDHLIILTPLPDSDPAAVKRVREMWEATGARVVSMDVKHHDEVLGATSHLPHMLAYALVDCLAGMQERDEIFKYAAGGFADFTRIASSSPEMWHDICFSNREQLLKILERFDTHLGLIKQAIKEGDSDGLLEIFIRAKRARDEFIDNRHNLANTINASE